MSDKKPTDNDIIDAIASNDDVSTADKVFMFIQLCDEKPLLDYLQKQAMMVKIGMISASPVDAFAAGVLRIAKPHLFEADL